jgi:hypothetical protein
MRCRALNLTSVTLFVVSSIIFGSASAQADDGHGAFGDLIVAPFSSELSRVLYKLNDVLGNPIDHAGEAFIDHLYPRLGEILETLERR